MNPHLEHEIMSPAFEKWHIRELGIDNSTFHSFKEEDRGFAHDHPFSFHTYIVKGGYKERVWIYDEINRKWFFADKTRYPGTAHYVHKDTIHQIIELLDGECITLATYDLPIKQETKYYKFEDGIAYYRYHYETDDKFRLVEI